ncbi:putative LRR receptor-like serine/threonine-protein kinase-like [Capsicum annuum]|nr:putative LRR receptor-like serine/threonine-protein kinase-like [Capsicum annuum]KAF3625398.1 putative LRR receptor-like serine/threonine-protein kinase-like [Capsicum annuum]
MSGLLYLDVSQNSIEEEVPQDIGELKAIVLYFYSNNLSGVIPSRLGELPHLQYLDLSNNSFSNQISLSFSNLISLEYLDLSLNSLSGTLPKSLEKLSYLTSINVSFNVLDGEIPSGGVFVNSTLQSFLGNKGLCGMHILEVPDCPITKSGQQSKSKKLVLKIVIPVVTSSFMTFLLVSIWIMKRTKIAKSKDAEKVLDLENEQVWKRFDIECEVMRNVRHRNLVPLITTCSSEYIRAFVLQYMSNGSLENWLYREDCQLNLNQRVIVMPDAAMEIEYLHHGNETPIVHCDLKTSNILLDEDMVAHVGDFGISKILAVSKSMEHTKTLGTLGYIAPEYGSEGIVSTSGDVYSYGIMLMEVLTKRRPTDEEICNENLDLRKWITQSFSGTMLEVVDANLFPEEEQITSKVEICIASMVELALDCTKENPESRITMKDVVKRLNKIKNTFLETDMPLMSSVVLMLSSSMDQQTKVAKHDPLMIEKGYSGPLCSKRPRVVALALPNLQLQGTISPSLANLSFLRELNLENNFFQGGIPYGLGHLPRLSFIDIQNNQLKGNIPTSLFQHRRVQKISLAFNELSGEMWKGLWYVPELKILSLRNNSLKGIIPPSVGNATKLKNFGLTGKRISGNLPNEISNMSQLAFLSLIDSQLTASISAALFNISSLVGMSVSLNSFSGPLLLDEGNIV